MRSIKFHTEKFKGRAAKVGNVAIGNETIPVYEISVWITESKLEDIMIQSLDLLDSKYEQEFLDLAQKMWKEIQKKRPFSLAFIFSYINRYYFPKCDERDDDNPVEGFLQTWVYGPDGGEWLTWMESPAVADKREKDEAFRTAFEKWALAKFLQLVFGDKCLPFALPHYGSEEQGFMNGRVSVGKLRAVHQLS